MTDLEEFETESAANVTAQRFTNPSETHFFEIEQKTDEEEALETLQSLTSSTASKILIIREADGGNLKHQFANFSTIEKHCESFIWTNDADFEQLYQYVRENYNGGIYRFQVRAGSRNGKTWRKTLADLPGFKARIVENNDESSLREQKPTPAPAQQPTPADQLSSVRETINDNLKFVRELKEIFGDVFGANQQNQSAPAQPSREQILIELAKASDDKETKKRCLDAIIGDGEEKQPQKTFADVITDVLQNPELIQKPLQMFAPFIAPMLQGMMQPAITPTAAPFVNMPSASTLPTMPTAPTPPPAQTPATTDDSTPQILSPIVATQPTRKPRKRQTEEQEQQ